MKKLLVILLLGLFLTPLMAQQTPNNVTTIWSPIQKVSKKVNLVDIAGYDNSGMYVLMAKTKNRNYFGEMSIVRYNSKMIPSKPAVLNMIYQGKKTVFEFAMQFNGEIYVFSSFENNKTDKKYLFFQSFNKSTMQLNKNLKKVAEVPLSKGVFNRAEGNFSFDISNDSSHLVLYYNLPFKKGEKEKFGFHVFDKQMNELWNKEVSLPYKDELCSVEDFKVDNTGNVYLLALVYKEKRQEKRLGSPNYKYMIFSYDSKSDEPYEYSVSYKDEFITDMKMGIADNLDLVCAGFYSAKGTFSIKGTFYLKIDHKTKEIVTSTNKQFDIEFITQAMSKRQEKKTKKQAEKGKNVELFNYDLDDLIIRSDGGVVMIGEQNYVRVHSYTTASANGVTITRTTYTYYFNDIIVVNIAPSGNIDWAHKIVKRQVSTDDDGYWSSYAMGIFNNQMVFLYNDNAENVDYEEGARIKITSKRRSSALLVGMDINGNQSRSALFSAKEAEILIVPQLSKQISDNEMVVFGKVGNKQRFAKLVF